ncbi:MAG: type III-B CRISPR module-associated protein Cmr3 [Candidatus Omnitrophica bacterium]|nr:type III-B CRISPR module-associated protein Cmr3 [Candidatus Omnitrophota bacterium]
MLKFIIKPFDVLFFGGGKPFNIGDTAKSIFPPFPHTFAAAICSKIYSEFKIDVSNILESVYGPFLFNERENKLYFPKPADIYTLRKKENGVFHLKLLGDDSFSLFKFENTNKPDDIEKLLIYQGKEDIGSFEGFISQDGLQDWVDGKEVKEDKIKRFYDVFEYERRVGIKQSMEIHTVIGEDGLYRIDYLRLKEGWSFIFYVEFNYENLRDSELSDEDKILQFFGKTPKVLKLGGEMKVIYYEVEKKDDLKSIIKKPKVKSEEVIKILFLTPSTFNCNKVFPSFSGVEIISAVINGYLNLAITSKGLKLDKFTKKGIKSGSVFYVKVLDESFVNNLWFDFPYAYRENNKEKNKAFIGRNLVIYGKLIN